MINAAKQVVLLIFAGAIGSLFTTTFLHQPAPRQSSASAPFTQWAAHRINEAPPPREPVFDFREAARRAIPAVVFISADPGSDTFPYEDTNPFRFFFDDDGFLPPFGREPLPTSGSGVIYRPDGYIITNQHVVDGAESLEVTLYDNSTYAARLVGVDRKTDLAVLKIDASGLPALELTDSDQAEVGEWVLAIGNPLELTSTVTAGIISAKGRSINVLEEENAIESFLQTDAVVNPGNSGGALVNIYGELLGINTAIASQTGLYQGYAFAIPSNLVVRIVEDIISYGSYRRAYLGINVSELDASYAQELGVSIAQGVVVEEILAGGSAEFSGLRQGDVIIEANGLEIRGVPGLQEIVGRAKPGDVMELVVLRQEKREKISIFIKPK